MNILCINVGNTHCHVGRVQGKVTSQVQDFLTTDLGLQLPRLLSRHDYAGVSYCSVVPDATAQLEAILHATIAEKPFRLDHVDAPGLTITYPKPAEIGPDRLANAMGTQVVAQAPAIVIDTGTATTFDLVSAREGFIGGVIAPGPAMMTQYLHEKTALLPQLSPDELSDPGRIGRSTRDAMKLGCIIGFSGLITALLERCLAEFRERGEPEPALLATGGGSSTWLKHVQAAIEYVPHLSLIGLAEAWQRAHGPEAKTLGLPPA
ncbi:MAG: type III pantothenate kinase [Verrucomicrobiota bacterium]